jgi:hypothetical protein
MIRSFKFLTDNDDDIPEGYINLENINIDSWMWESLMEPSDATYDIVSVDVNGIIEFLRIFPSDMIVPVSSIVGPNGTVHNGENEGFGWGFNIQTDPIHITYLRYRGNP